MESVFMKIQIIPNKKKSTILIGHLVVMMMMVKKKKKKPEKKKKKDLQLLMNSEKLESLPEMNSISYSTD
jgi:hypothetical protein